MNQGFTMRLSTISLVLSLLVMNTAHAEVYWVGSSRGEPLPPNALLGGIEGVGPNRGAHLHVCRAILADSVHSGKLIGGSCNIPFAGRENEVARYEVAVATGGAWGPPSPGYAGALVGGYEPGRTLYVCRVNYREPITGGYLDRGFHPGKVVDGKCNFGWGGREIDSYSNFEVFYPYAAPDQRPRKRYRDSYDQR